MMENMIRTDSRDDTSRVKLKRHHTTISPEENPTYQPHDVTKLLQVGHDGQSYTSRGRRVKPKNIWEPDSIIATSKKRSIESTILHPTKDAILRPVLVRLSSESVSYYLSLKRSPPSPVLQDENLNTVTALTTSKSGKKIKLDRNPVIRKTEKIHGTSLPGTSEFVEEFTLITIKAQKNTANYDEFTIQKKFLTEEKIPQDYLTFTKDVQDLPTVEILPENFPTLQKLAEEFPTLEKISERVQTEKHFAENFPKIFEDFQGVEKLFDPPTVENNSERLSTEEQITEDFRMVEEIVEDYPTVEEIVEAFATVEEIVEDYPTAEEIDEDFVTVEEIGEDYSTVKGIGEDYSTVEEIGEDLATVEEIGEDYPTVEEIVEDFTIVEETGEDFVTVEEIGEDYSTVEEIGEDFAIVEGIGEDYPTMEEIVEDYSTVEEIVEDFVTEEIPQDVALVEKIAEGLSPHENITQVPTGKPFAAEVRITENVAKKSPTKDHELQKFEFANKILMSPVVLLEQHKFQTEIPKSDKVVSIPNLGTKNEDSEAKLEEDRMEYPGHKVNPEPEHLHTIIPETVQTNCRAEPSVFIKSQPRSPPIIITDGPLVPAYYLVSREGFGLRVIRVRDDGTREAVDEVMYEKVRNRRTRMAKKVGHAK